MLVTVEYGKESGAELEALDCIFPKDPTAFCIRQPYGGLILISTTLPSDEAAAMIGSCRTTSIHKVLPIDSMVESDLGKLCSEALRLVPPGSERVAVDCARRGRFLPSSQLVEEEVGRLLKTRGMTIDLVNPRLVVRIDIIGSFSTISVRPPSGFITKKEGPAHG